MMSVHPLMTGIPHSVTLWHLTLKHADTSMLMSPLGGMNHSVVRIKDLIVEKILLSGNNVFTLNDNFIEVTSVIWWNKVLMKANNFILGNIFFGMSI